MNISAQEKIMYDVMKAIYDSGIPISFKGSMVLKACLLEAGYTEETRHTVDIDANWNSDVEPTTEQMVESLQKAIDKMVWIWRCAHTDRTARNVLPALN